MHPSKLRPRTRDEVQAEVAAAEVQAEHDAAQTVRSLAGVGGGAALVVLGLWGLARQRERQQARRWSAD